MRKKILVIDDEELVLGTVRMILEDQGYQVVSIPHPDRGIAEALRNEYDLIVSDLRMAGKNGGEVTRAIRERRPSARIVVLTACPEDSCAAQALESGALAVLRKPFDIGKIADFLE
jgi:DNA-binding response OmpR family regulator